MKYFLFFYLLFSSNLILAEAIKMNAGEYEMTVKNKMSNLPTKLPPSVLEMLNKPHVIKLCFKDISNNGIINNFVNNPNCKNLKIEQKGNRLTWKGICSSQIKVEVGGFIDIGKNAYSGENSAITKVPNQIDMKVVNEFKAIRLGDCK